MQDLISHYETLWSVRDVRILSSRYHSTVMIGIHDNHRVCIKRCHDFTTYVREKTSLSYLNGTCCITPLAYDDASQSYLMPYLYPGTSLKDYFPLKDAEATNTILSIAQSLATPLINLPPYIPAICDEISSLRTCAGIDASLRARAFAIANELIESSTAVYLLHGDLHHGNCIYDEKIGWIAIDPKGIIGERAYELGQLIRNPSPHASRHHAIEGIIRDRLDACARIEGIDPTRVLAWAYVQCILASCWDMEDKRDGSHWLDLAMRIKQLDSSL